MKKIIDYKIVTGNSDIHGNKLSDNVNKAIKDGWQPLGGPAFDKHGNVRVWTMVQVMVKYED